MDLVVSFLCTRVSNPTEEDWGKLQRLLTYLKNTIDMPRIIGASSLNKIITWVDASYATHNDFKVHTGGCVGMGTVQE